MFESVARKPLCYFDSQTMLAGMFYLYLHNKKKQVVNTP